MEPVPAPHDNDLQQKAAAGKAANRFGGLPKSKRITLIAAAGVVIALLVGGSAWLLSAGDSSSQSALSEGSNSTTTNASTTPGTTPQSSASTSGDQTGSSASSGGSDNQAKPPTNPPASAVNTTPSAATTITIAAMAFSPASLTVGTNTTVTWQNNDTVTHAIDKAEGQSVGPHSPQLKPGASYSYSYPTAGTYKYICVIHPSMSGTIIVK